MKPAIRVLLCARVAPRLIHRRVKVFGEWRWITEPSPDEIELRLEPEPYPGLQGKPDDGRHARWPPLDGLAKKTNGPTCGDICRERGAKEWQR